jgi:hypothetical protein
MSLSFEVFLLLTLPEGLNKPRDGWFALGEIE